MTRFLLVPGAGGDAWYWHRLVPELVARGHTATAVELPADDPSAGLARYADAVVEAWHGNGDVVVVGQSLGGFTAPLVCDRLPVRELVLVNAMIPRPRETAGAWWDATGHEMPIDFDPVTHFFHDVPADVRAEALAGGKEQREGPFADPWPRDEWPDVATRVVVGTDDRFFTADFQRRVALDRLGIAPELTPGGHLVALSRPAELADLLVS